MTTAKTGTPLTYKLCRLWFYFALFVLSAILLSMRNCHAQWLRIYADTVSAVRDHISDVFLSCVCGIAMSSVQIFRIIFRARVSNFSSPAWKAIYNCKVFFLIRAQNANVLWLFLTQFIYRIFLALTNYWRRDKNVPLFRRQSATSCFCVCARHSLHLLLIQFRLYIVPWHGH